MGGDPASASITSRPSAGADPRTIVEDFLRGRRRPTTPTTPLPAASSAADAQARWSDTTVTIVDQIEVGNFTGGNVAVSGRDDRHASAPRACTRPCCRVTAAAAARPAARRSRSPRLRRVQGQRPVAHRHAAERTWWSRPRFAAPVHPAPAVLLRPGPSNTWSPTRATPRSPTPGCSATWLMTQLVAGPRPELQNAVTTEFPAQSDPKGRSRSGARPRSRSPGAGQLDPPTRNRSPRRSP